MKRFAIAIGLLIGVGLVLSALGALGPNTIPSHTVLFHSAVIVRLSVPDAGLTRDQCKRLLRYYHVEGGAVFGPQSSTKALCGLYTTSGGHQIFIFPWTLGDGGPPGDQRRGTGRADGADG